MIKNEPLISIITVALNAGDCIEGTILSVINQSYPNIEYLIIDGGSTDKTQEIVNKYREKISYYISERDNGVYDAMNKGINAATGDWIYFLGTGDILHEVIDKLAGLLKNSNIIYYGDVFHNDIQKIYDGKFSAFKLAVTNICHQAMFYPAPVLKKYKFNTTYKILADHDLNMRCYGDKNISFKYLSLVICTYQGGGVSSLNPDLDFYKDKMAVVRQNFSLIVYLYVYSRRLLARLINKHRY